MHVVLSPALGDVHRRIIDSFTDLDQLDKYYQLIFLLHFAYVCVRT
jgi:hypothetical protein